MEKKSIKKVKDMKRGVYTVTCAKCGQYNYVHVDNEGYFDPLRCRSCKVNFLGLEKGERNNEYIAEIPKEDEPDVSEELKIELKKKDSKQDKKTTRKLRINYFDPNDN